MRPLTALAPTLVAGVSLLGAAAIDRSPVDIPLASSDETGRTAPEGAPIAPPAPPVAPGTRSVATPAGRPAPRAVEGPTLEDLDGAARQLVRRSRDDPASIAVFDRFDRLAREASDPAIRQRALRHALERREGRTGLLLTALEDPNRLVFEEAIEWIDLHGGLPRFGPDELVRLLDIGRRSGDPTLREAIARIVRLELQSIDPVLADQVRPILAAIPADDRDLSFALPTNGQASEPGCQHEDD